jgi:hypothetical protein
VVNWRRDVDARAALPPPPPLAAFAAEPLVSICVTNHDYGRFVGEAVDSALGQTYPRVEVIVVDDGSADDSLDVLSRYGERIRLVAQENAGQAAAATRAAERSRGDVVMFLDADDSLDPGAAALAVETFRRRPSLVLAQWRMRTVDADGTDLGLDRPPRPGLMPSGDLRAHLLRFRNWHSQLTSAIAYRGDVVRLMLPVQPPPGDRNGLEHYFNALVPFFGTVQSLDAVASSYRIHGTGIGTTHAVDGSWPRRLMRFTEASHARVRSLVADLGLPDPGPADAPLDPAFFGWRLWSLRIEPADHPYPRDRALTLMAKGIRASLAHRHFPFRHKAKRAAWFVAMGLAPRRFVPRVLEWYSPDGPRIVAGRIVG